MGDEDAPVVMCRDPFCWMLGVEAEAEDEDRGEDDDPPRDAGSRVE